MSSPSRLKISHAFFFIRFAVAGNPIRMNFGDLNIQRLPISRLQNQEGKRSNGFACPRSAFFFRREPDVDFASAGHGDSCWHHYLRNCAICSWTSRRSNRLLLVRRNSTDICLPGRELELENETFDNGFRRSRAPSLSFSGSVLQMRALVDLRFDETNLFPRSRLQAVRKVHVDFILI